MQRKLLYLVSLAAILSFSGSCGNGSPATDPTTADSSKPVTHIKTADVLYTADTLQCHGFIAYDPGRQGRLPIVVIVHEWWGLNDYVKTRARQLANLGYFAIAADMYGNDRIAANPEEAMALARPYYINPYIIRNRLAAAISKAATFSQADSTRVAAIGYCFGGFVVLNASKMGLPLKGTVSFHGDLSGPAPLRGAVKGEILVCQGGDDQLVPETQRTAFRKTMDSAGVKYLFMTYPGAQHAFTNPGATAIGQQFHMPVSYNAAADSASWADMKNFFSSVLK